jgi:hypothetical protein
MEERLLEFERTRRLYGKDKMIITTYPYLATEKDFKRFRDADIVVTFDKIKQKLDYSDLPKKEGSESETHRALKKYAEALLKKLGANDAQFEGSFIDVSSRKLRIAVECGDTPIDRIWIMLFHEDYGNWIKEVWCIYEINDGKIEIVKFVKPPKLLEYEREIGWFKE